MTDIRMAVRSLAKHPGFAAVALLTIALGVGANGAVFSILAATLTQPLPYPQSDRLVAIFETAQRTEVERRAISYPNFLDWQRDVRSFEAMSAVLSARLTLTIGDTPERLYADLVSGGYFDMLGLRPVLGRGIETRDDSPGAAPVLVISDELWRHALGADPQILGRRITVNGEPATVVGVMPPGISGYEEDVAAWVPIARFAGPSIVNDRGQRSIDVAMARLAPGVTLEQARTEMDALAVRLDAEYPSETGKRGVGLTPLRDELFGQVTPMLRLLMGAVAFVVLIACANVASLLLARGTDRQGELAVRAALGASRGRIVRQLLTESVVLALLGGAAGIPLALWGLDLLGAISPRPLSLGEVRLDPGVLAFSFGVCLVAGLLSGLVPAITASRSRLIAAVQTAGRSSDRQSTLLRRAFVTAEIALAMVLLIGAGLMLRTMDRLTTFDPGFELDGLLTLRLALPLPPDGETPAETDAAAARLATFSSTLLERVRTLPGVAAASLSSDVPLGTSTSATNVRIDGRDDPAIRVYRHLVTPGHFRTIGTPLIKGRDFTDDDRFSTQRVVIVSRAMADRHFPGGDALHRRIWRGDLLLEIVGIVGDLKHRDLIEPESADPDIYLPLYQTPFYQALAVIARTSGDVDPVVAAVRRAVLGLDPSMPVFQVETGEQLVKRQTAGTRFISTLLGAFAVVALALTIVGIYGVTAYTVSRQTRQVGIRIALGATPAAVLRLVLLGGLTFIVAGIVLGTVAALGLTRLLASRVFGISATDPATFAGVIALLALVALSACLIPALRATRVDPLQALRQ